ncbi:hypothetical protein F183_A07480 [Bryobacterales bacterium F-183]|nr:hypothetical protein F183_A07480 [Bryobacterales bacterium F-183]
MRWLAIGIFILSSFCNYLDRQILSAAAPLIKTEFALNNQEFANLLSAFALTYAFSSMFVGWWLDRIGLDKGIMISVAAWSAVATVTGFASSAAMLLACRAALGVAEAGSIPAFGKANARYLKSSELAIGTGLNQLGLSLAGVTAPFLVGSFGNEVGWRSIYVYAGLGGLLWIPLWWFTSRAIPGQAAVLANAQNSMPIRAILRDRRFLGIVAANILSMILYSFWTSWTTLYFVQTHSMPQELANTRYALVPPIFATLGGLTGGAVVFRLMSRGVPVFRARMTVCWAAGLAVLSTAALPFVHSAAAATVLICASFFAVVAMSANVYAMPIDLYGAGRAGFGVATLTAAFGLMQAVTSPLIGRAVDQSGFGPVCVVLSVFPLLACIALWWSHRDDAAA